MLQSTVNCPSSASLVGQLEQLGAVWDAQTSRDVFIYAANCTQTAMADVLRLIGDTAWRPLLTEEEVRGGISIAPPCYRSPPLGARSRTTRAT